MFARKEVIITLVSLMALSSVAFSVEKLSGSLSDDAELIAALASQVNDEPQVEATLESLAKPAQTQSESPEASDCACDKTAKSAENKATPSKPVAAKAVKNSKSGKKLVADKKSGKKFKVITVTVPMDQANEGDDLEETAVSDLGEKKDKMTKSETKFDAPEDINEENEEMAAAESQEESGKVTKSKAPKNDAGKEKETSKKTKTDKKRSKRDAKSKLSKGKKSKGSKKNKSNNKK